MGWGVEGRTCKAEEQHEQSSGRKNGGIVGPVGRPVWLDGRGHGNRAEEVVRPDLAGSLPLSEGSRKPPTCVT